MKRPELKPATASDFISFYGSPPKNTVRAIVCVLDGRVLGVAGIERHHGFYVAFSDISTEMRSYKKTILSAGIRLVEMIRQCSLPVVSIQNLEEKTSRNFLTRLGFVPTEEPEVFLWHG